MNGLEQQPNKRDDSNRDLRTNMEVAQSIREKQSRGLKLDAREEEMHQEFLNDRNTGRKDLN